MEGMALEMGSSSMQQHQPHQDREYTNNSNTSSSSSTTTTISKSDQPKETAPKKMTWASIASQPAKPQIRVSYIYL